MRLRHGRNARGTFKGRDRAELSRFSDPRGIRTGLPTFGAIMDDSSAYDVFLSHSSKDKPVVRALAERLRKDGLRVWFDEWVLKPGDNLPPELRRVAAIRELNREKPR